MEYYLTIDRGNSKLKAALWDAEGRLIAHRSAPSATVASSLALDIITPVFTQDTTLKACAYSSVAQQYNAMDLAGLEEICPQVLNVTSAVNLPFVLEYPTLGADRIAAICGALAITPKGRPILVVDSGTAITYEFINADGLYEGGNIAPGLRMRLSVLHERTAALPEISTDGEVPLVGYSTDTAMRSGVVRGMLGEILYYMSQIGPEAKVVLTGGGNAYLSEKSLLTFEHTLDAHLVMRGLYTILRYNESN